MENTLLNTQHTAAISDKSLKLFNRLAIFLIILAITGFVGWPLYKHIRHNQALEYEKVGKEAYESGDWQRAVEMFRLSLESYLFLKDSQGLVKQYDTLGALYANHNDLPTAIEMYLNSMCLTCSIANCPPERDCLIAKDAITFCYKINLTL